MQEGSNAVDMAVSEPTRELRETMLASERLTARLARKTGMSSSDAKALYLLESNGRMGVAELAEELGMRAASATVLVDRLERAGHAVRERDPQDRRRVWVSTTPAAMEALLPVWLPGLERLDAVGAALTPDEQRVGAQDLRDVHAAIDATS